MRKQTVGRALGGYLISTPVLSYCRFQCFAASLSLLHKRDLQVNNFQGKHAQYSSQYLLLVDTSNCLDRDGDMEIS